MALHNPFLAATCLVLTLTLRAPARAEAISFQALDFRPFATSADGSVVVGDDQSTGDYEAVRWTRDTGMVRLGFLGSDVPHRSHARGVSADGSVVVGNDYAAPGFKEAFRWTEATGMVGLGVFPGGDGFPAGEGFGSRAEDASADGSVVVGASGDGQGNYRAFRWTAQTGMVSLGTLPEDSYSQAYGVSADGSVVVGQSFRWTADGGMVGLDMCATAVSADGSVVVGTTDYYNPLRRTADNGMSWVYEANAHGVSADGSIIVGANWVFGGPWEGPDSVWIWSEVHGMRNLQEMLVDDFGLDLTGWQLREPADISDDGRVIVGWADVWSDETQRWTRQGFRAVIPEPSTLALLGCATLCVLAYGWQTQLRD